MSLITHQLKKDTRRLWPFLVLWWLLLAVQTVTAVRAWDLDDNPPLRDLPDMLLAGHHLLAILLTALVILEEPLVGTRAFWLTRPLPRTDLMLSKFLFLLLYVTLPAALAELCALTSLGLELGRWPAVGAEIVVQHGAFLILATVPAVLSPNLRTFALVGVVAYFVATWGGYAFILLLRGLLDLPRMSETASATLYDSREALKLLLIVVFGTAAATHQYLTRHTRRTIALVIFGALPVLLASRLGPWDVLAPRGSFNEAAIRATLNETPTGLSWHSDGEEDPETRRIYGLLKIGGAPSAYAYRFATISGRLQVDGGPTFRSRNVGYGEMDSEEALGLAVGDPQAFRSQGSSGTLDDLLIVSESDYSRWSQTPGTYTARIEVQAFRFEVVGEMPLMAGFSLESGFDRLLLEKVEIRPERFELSFRRRSLRTLFGERPPYDQPLFLFRHRSSGEIRRFPGGRSSGDSRRTLVFSRPVVSQATPFYGVHPFDQANEKIPTDWLREADLVVVRRVVVGRFVLPFKIEDFRMADYTREAWDERMRTAAIRRNGQTDA